MRKLPLITAFIIIVGLIVASHVASKAPKVPDERLQIHEIKQIPPDLEIFKEPPKSNALVRYIDRLAHEYECAGCGDHYRRLDSNGEYSYACLQFQEATFRSEVKRFGLITPGMEIMEKIYDCAFQKNLAYLMFKNEPRAWEHWYNSVMVGFPGRKAPLGLPPA